MSSSAGPEVRSAARQTGDSPVVEKGARLGYVASGLLHLLIGWIALKVAWDIDGGTDDADQSGALASLGNQATGPLLLWLAVAGFVLLAIWQLTEAIVGRHGGGLTDRAKAVGKTVMYAALAFTAVRVIQRSGGSSEETTQSFTEQVMAAPGGPSSSRSSASPSSRSVAITSTRAGAAGSSTTSWSTRADRSRSPAGSDTSPRASPSP